MTPRVTRGSRVTQPADGVSSAVGRPPDAPHALRSVRTRTPRVRFGQDTAEHARLYPPPKRRSQRSAGRSQPNGAAGSLSAPAAPQPEPLALAAPRVVAEPDACVPLDSKWFGDPADLGDVGVPVGAYFSDPADRDARAAARRAAARARAIHRVGVLARAGRRDLLKHPGVRLERAHRDIEAAQALLAECGRDLATFRGRTREQLSRSGYDFVV